VIPNSTEEDHWGIEICEFLHFDGIKWLTCFAISALSFLLLYDGTRTVFCIVLYHTAVMLYTAAAAADDDDDVSMSDVVTSCTDV